MDQKVKTKVFISNDDVIEVNTYKISIYLATCPYIFVLFLAR